MRSWRRWQFLCCWFAKRDLIWALLFVPIQFMNYPDILLTNADFLQDRY